MFVLVFHKRVVYAYGHLVESCLVVEERFLVGGGYKTELYEARRHRCEPQHCEVALVHSLVRTACRTTYVLLQHLGEVDAFRQIAVLHKLEHDVALRRVGVVSHIMLLVVFLKQYDGVLAFRHLKVCFCGLRAAVAECVRLEATGYASLFQCVGVH